MTLPKNPGIRWGGNQLWWLDRTPNTDRNFESQNENQKNYTLIQPSDKLEENLDKNMIKNYNLIDDRMELKIIPFKYEKKNK